MASKRQKTAPTKTVIVLGTLGIGKSTLLNRVAGGEPFETYNGSESCTQIPSSFTFEKDGHKVRVVDTPGTNDTQMPAPIWIAAFRKWAEQNPDPIHMAFIVFSASMRPDNAQKQDLLTVFEAVANVGSKNIGVIFTFCDGQDMRKMVQKTKGSKELVMRWKGWLTTMAEACSKPEFTNMSDKNVFLFNEEGGKTDPDATTQADLLAWIDAVVPEETPAIVNKEISMDKLVEAGVATGDPALLKFISAQLEDMRKENKELKANSKETEAKWDKKLENMNLSHEQAIAVMKQAARDTEARLNQAKNDGLLNLLDVAGKVLLTVASPAGGLAAIAGHRALR